MEFELSALYIAKFNTEWKWVIFLKNARKTAFSPGKDTLGRKEEEMLTKVRGEGCNIRFLARIILTEQSPRLQHLKKFMHAQRTFSGIFHYISMNWSRVSMHVGTLTLYFWKKKCYLIRSSMKPTRSYRSNRLTRKSATRGGPTLLFPKTSRCIIENFLRWEKVD